MIAQRGELVKHFARNRHRSHTSSHQEDGAGSAKPYGGRVTLQTLTT